jgi:hypothetical protein
MNRLVKVAPKAISVLVNFLCRSFAPSSSLRSTPR